MQGRMIPEAAMPLFKEIHDGHPNAKFFAHYLEYLAFHMPSERIMPALLWMLRNGVKGNTFVAFVRWDCKGSALEFIRELTRRIQREKELRALIAKKDVRV